MILSNIFNLKFSFFFFYRFIISSAICSISTNQLVGQKAKLYGVVLDSSETILPNANIIAFPEFDDGETVFSISNIKGEFSLDLETGSLYAITISYLGYQKETFKLKIDQNKKLDFVLSPKVNQLDEVVLKYRIPVTVKEDTITYNVEAFTTGNERKVRELLKRLPGIEVDFEGNVTAQGQNITKVLVEGELFFTGDSKLAVNNIPAKVVDQIEIIDNYDDIGFLKNFNDSSQKALNIKLKKDSKKFAFGDLENGIGIKNRYQLNPTLFYYGPKTSVNFIGNLGNTGEKPFSFKDYLSFEGRSSGFFFENTNSFDDAIDNEVSEFLRNGEYNSYNNVMGAFSAKQKIGLKASLTTFIIVNKSNTTSLNTIENQYLNDSSPILEARSNSNDLSNFSSIGKTTLELNPKKDELIRFNILYKVADNKNTGRIGTNFESTSNEFIKRNDLNSFKIAPSFDYNRKFSLSHSLRTFLDYSYQENKSASGLSTDEPFLENFLPIQDGSPISIIRNSDSDVKIFQFGIKDYWAINNRHHIYTSFGVKRLKEGLNTNENQLLNTGDLINFNINGFGNNIQYNFQDNFFGIEYKFSLKKLTSKFGLFGHNYLWRNQQENRTIENRVDDILPKIRLNYEFNSGENLTFQFRRNLVFPRANQLTRNLNLLDFNSIYRGNPFLSNKRLKNYSLTYLKFNFFKGLTFNVLLNYQVVKNNFKNIINLDEINQISDYININLPESTFTGLFRFSKQVNLFKYTFKTSLIESRYRQILNSRNTPNLSRNTSFVFNTRSIFKNMPNFELDYAYEPTKYKTSLNDLEFIRNSLSLKVDYELKGFGIRGDYSRSKFVNKTRNTKSEFDIGNFLLSYRKEDSPWYYEISANNIFNTRFQRHSNITNVLISDNRTFVMPRIVMFKISYSL